MYNDYPLATEKGNVIKEMLLDYKIFFLRKNENHISNAIQNCKEKQKNKAAKSKNKMLVEETMLFLVNP